MIVARVALGLVLCGGLVFGGSRADRAWVADGDPGVVLGSLTMVGKKRSMQVADVSQAISIMGGSAHVAKSLGISKSELTRMEKARAVDRGFFAQFFVTLQWLGYDPQPALFGLSHWSIVVIPRKGGRSTKT